MARTTAFAACQAARLIAGGAVEEKGVRFPEQLFTGALFETMRSGLAARGVRMAHREEA
jgi:saccharopine dehydrogenase-like NADP-dependent oxidoreductase